MDQPRTTDLHWLDYLGLLCESVLIATADHAFTRVILLFVRKNYAFAVTIVGSYNKLGIFDFYANPMEVVKLCYGNCFFATRPNWSTNDTT